MGCGVSWNGGLGGRGRVGLRAACSPVTSLPEDPLPLLTGTASLSRSPLPIPTLHLLPCPQGPGQSVVPTGWGAVVARGGGTGSEPRPTHPRRAAQASPVCTPPGHTMTVVMGVSVLSMALLFSLVPPKQSAFPPPSTQGDLSPPLGLRGCCRAWPACPELDDHRRPQGRPRRSCLHPAPAAWVGVGRAAQDKEGGSQGGCPALQGVVL